MQEAHLQLPHARRVARVAALAAAMLAARVVVAVDLFGEHPSISIRGGTQPPSPPSPFHSRRDSAPLPTLPFAAGLSPPLLTLPFAARDSRRGVVGVVADLFGEPVDGHAEPLGLLRVPIQLID